MFCFVKLITYSLRASPKHITSTLQVFLISEEEPCVAELGILMSGTL